MRSRGTRRDALDAIGVGFGLQATVLVSGVLAARLLGPESRGLLALLWVVALALSQVATLGMPAATAVFLARGGCDRRALIAVCGRGAALQAAAATSVQALVLALLFRGRGDAAITAAVITLAATPAMIAQVYGLAVLQGLGHVRAMQALRLLPTAVYALALIVAFAAGADALPLVALAWAGGYVVAAALTVAIVARITAAVAPEPHARTVPTGELRRFGLRSMLGSVSPLETFRIDQLLVGLVLSPVQLGLYVAALAFTNLPRFIAQGIGQTAVVRIAPLRALPDIRRAILRHTALSAGVAVAISVPLALLARPLTDLFFGAAFAGAAAMMQVVLISTVLVCARRVLGDCLRGAGHPTAGSLGELCSYVAVVPALVVGMLTAGAIGVAWALVASSLVSLAVLLVLTWRLGLLVAGRALPAAAAASVSAR